MQTTQVELPFYESPEDALRAAIQALGGAKQVGAKLWGDLTPDNAGRKLLDATNPARSEKLSLGQVMRVLQLARDAGCHEPMLWICAELGYEAKPVEPDAQIDRIVSVVDEAAKTMAAGLAALERLQRLRGQR